MKSWSQKSRWDSSTFFSVEPEHVAKYMCLSCPSTQSGLWYAWCIYMCTSVPTSTAVFPLVRVRHQLLYLLSCQPQGASIRKHRTFFSQYRGKGFTVENKNIILSLERFFFPRTTRFTLFQHPSDIKVIVWMVLHTIDWMKVYFVFDILILGGLSSFLKVYRTRLVKNHSPLPLYLV